MVNLLYRKCQNFHYAFNLTFVGLVLFILRKKNFCPSFPQNINHSKMTSLRRYIYIYVCVCVCVCVCMCVGGCVHRHWVYVYIYTYIYIYMYTQCWNLFILSLSLFNIILDESRHHYFFVWWGGNKVRILIWN